MEQSLRQNSNFRTKDLYEAAALYCKGVSLVNLEREGRQCWFVFGDFERCRELSGSYWQGTLIVNAKDYADAIRTLKDRIFSQA